MQQGKWSIRSAYDLDLGTYQVSVKRRPVVGGPGVSHLIVIPEEETEEFRDMVKGWILTFPWTSKFEEEVIG